MLLTFEPGGYHFIYVRVSRLATLDRSRLSRILLELSGSKEAVDRHLYSINRWLLNSGNWTAFTSGTPALRNDWDVCRITTYLYYGQLGSSFYLRESPCRREEVLSAHRGFHRSESVVFHLVYWMSFLSCLVCVRVSGFVLFLHSEDIRLFAFHLFSCPENSWPTTRRFDDRLSLERAQHDQKNKKLSLLSSLLSSLSLSLSLLLLLLSLL